MKLRIPWKKLLRIFAFGLVLVITVLALVATWFSFQGRREWVRTRDALLARGEKLSAAELAPPQIPAEENFFADPLWEELAGTVPEASELGVSYHPALPRPQWQIEQLNIALTDAEVASLQKEFPELAAGIAGKRWAEILSRFKQDKELPPSFSPGEAAFALAVLKTKEPILNRIELLAGRPDARFPVRYEDGVRASLNHVTYINTCGALLRFRACARLALGRNSAALGDVLLMFRLARTVSTEPTLICALVETSINGMAISAAKKGIPFWTQAELLQLEGALKQINMLPHLALGLRGERAGFNIFAEEMKRNPRETVSLLQVVSADGGTPLVKSPWWTMLPISTYLYAFGDSEKAFVNKHLQERIDGIERDLPVIKLEGQKKREEAFHNLVGNTSWRFRHILASIWLPAVSSVTEKLAHVQNEVNMAIAASALQRFWNETKSLPDTLDELVPEYLAKVPIDIVNGAPLSYRKTGPDTFVLWSFGANETDEGGVAGAKRTDNDWVWNGKTTAN